MNIIQSLTKNLVIPLFLIISSFSTSFTQQKNIEEDIKQILNSANIPGLSLVYFEDGKIHTNGAWGLSSLDTRQAVDPETVFAAASLSKCIFAYIVLQLVEENVLDLDKPLFEYYQYKDIEHDERSKLVTARMVLTHSSGLPNWRKGDLNFQYDPDEKFRYSGEGFVWLQRTVENLTEMTLEELAQQRVFKPLGLDRSSYLWLDKFEENHAIPHTEFLSTRSKYKPKEGNAAHSLQTTAVDFAKFLLAITAHHGISMNSVKRMLEPGINVTKDENNATSIHWGLGLGLQITSAGTEFWHWGDNGTFKAYFTVSPAKNNGLVYFTNSQNGLSITPEIVEAFMNTKQPAWEWNGYAHYTSAVFKMRKSMLEGGTIDPSLINSNGKLDTSQLKERTVDWLAWRLLSTRRLNEANMIYQLIHKSFPNSKMAEKKLAKSYLYMGKNLEALGHFENLLQKSEEDEEVKNMIARLKGKLQTKFQWTIPGFHNTKMISVVGDFNNWDRTSDICVRKNGNWDCRVQAEADTIKYSLFVDGVFMPDPDNPNVEYVNGTHLSILNYDQKE